MDWSLFALYCIDIQEHKLRGVIILNKTQEYEAYKQYLRSLNLSSAEYEKRIREWRRRHKF